MFHYIPLAYNPSAEGSNVCDPPSQYNKEWLDEFGQRLLSLFMN